MTGHAEQSKKNEVALAKVSLTIVLIFILCHSIKWIPNIYELLRLSSSDKRKWPSWIESTTHVAHFLMSFNSSVNFYVYCAKHVRFSCKQNSGSSENEFQTFTNTTSVCRKSELIVDRSRSEVSTSVIRNENFV